MDSEHDPILHLHTVHRKFPSLAAKISTFPSLQTHHLLSAADVDIAQSHQTPVILQLSEPQLTEPLTTDTFSPSAGTDAFQDTMQETPRSKLLMNGMNNSNNYVPLPFAHTGLNLFAAELKQKNTLMACTRLLIDDWKQLFNIKTHRSCTLLLIAAGFNMGATAGWTAIVQDMISPLGLTHRIIGFFGASLMISQVIGALIGGPIVSRCFNGRLKRCLCIMQFLDILWFAAGGLVLPNVLNGDHVLLLIDNEVVEFTVLLCLGILLGLTFGITLFLYIQSLAEVAYLIEESSFTSAVYLIGLPTMILVIQIGSINTSIVTLLSLGLVVISFVMCCIVDVAQRRAKM